MTTDNSADAYTALTDWWAVRGRRYAHRALWVYLLLSVYFSSFVLLDQAADPYTYSRVYDDPELLMRLNKVHLAMSAVAIALQVPLLRTGRFSRIALLLVVAGITLGFASNGWIKTCCG